jgi:phosphoglycerate dehydrogenase-like enzyme
VKRRRGPTRKRPAARRLNVLVTVPFAEPQLERLRRVSPRLTVTQAKPETADYTTTDVLYAMTLPRDLSRAPNLSWVQVHMAGVNGIYDHPIYANRAIALTTASGVHAATVAEYAMTTILALAHRVPRMVEWQGKGVWPPDEQRWPLFVPTPVRGATLGVIGYGSIGRELARIATTAFAMTVLACKRDPKRRADPGYCPPGTGDPAGALPDEWFSPERLDALLARSDVVVMCAPLTRETHHMIGARELRAMKPTAYFVNVGRGASVDENALAQALKERRIAGAAVDVFAQEPPPSGHPLYAVDNVIVSPHVSGFVATYDDDCCRLFAENLRRRLAGTPLLNLVDRTKGY